MVQTGCVINETTSSKFSIMFFVTLKNSQVSGPFPSFLQTVVDGYCRLLAELVSVQKAYQELLIASLKERKLNMERLTDMMHSGGRNLTPNGESEQVNR